jgi:hypothetical protein
MDVELGSLSCAEAKRLLGLEARSRSQLRGGRIEGPRLRPRGGSSRYRRCMPTTATSSRRAPSQIVFHEGAPAVNVRDRHIYANDPEYSEFYRRLPQATIDAEWQVAAEDFWRVIAPELAAEAGYGRVFASGRSNGWLSSNMVRISQIATARTDSATTRVAGSRSPRTSDTRSTLRVRRFTRACSPLCASAAASKNARSGKGARGR